MNYGFFLLLSRKNDEQTPGMTGSPRRTDSPAVKAACLVFALSAATLSWAHNQKIPLTLPSKPLPVMQGPVNGQISSKSVDLQIDCLNRLHVMCKERQRTGQRYDLSSGDVKAVLKAVDGFQNFGELLCFAQDCWDYYRLSVDGYAPFGSYARVFLVAFWDCCDRFSVSRGKNAHDALVYLSQKVDTFSKTGIDVLIERQQQVK